MMKAPGDVLRDMGQAEKAEGEPAEELTPVSKVTLDVTGSRGKRYQGVFHFKCLQLGDQVQLAKLKAHYLPQGAAADPNGMLLVEQICYLEVALLDPKPDWWRPFQLYDATPVSALYTEVASYEARFHGEDPDRRGLPEVSGAEGEHDGGDPPAGDAAVGRKVQPPAQRRETLIAHSAGGG